MSNMPEYLRAMNLFVDGKGYAGQVENVEPPKLTLKTEDYRGGAMDAPVEIDLGMEKLSCSFTINKYDPVLFALWGLAPGNMVNITLRGAMDDGSGKIKAVLINLTGSWKELDMGSWKAGDKSGLKIQVALKYYALAIDGKPVVLIDIPNMKRVVGGKDMLADVRKAIGL